MENWAEIRRSILADGLGASTACREYDIHWDTLTKILCGLPHGRLHDAASQRSGILSQSCSRPQASKP